MWTQLTNSQTSIARHRETLGEMSKDDCSAFEHTAKFHPGMAVKVSAAIQSGEPFSDASRNGKRDCGIHLFSSSYPLGNAGFLGTPFADAQTVGFHEYFHTVQHAYIFTLDRGTREDMLGPMWFVEGGGEFMAQTTTQRLRDAGALTASDWAPLPERMRWKMEAMQKWLVDNPGSKLSEVGAGPDQNVGYHYGAWAHAYLSYEANTDVLLGSFYKNLTDLDWEGAFTQTYGKTSAQFIAEFYEFLQLPIEDQLEILP